MEIVSLQMIESPLDNGLVAKENRRVLHGG
jgi:hypothetical protein